MIALRFNIPGKPLDEALKEFSPYDACGAQAYIDNVGQSIIVQFPDDQFEIIRHCIEGKLDDSGKAVLEHALSAWDMEYNQALDTLAENGMDKEDRKTQLVAEGLAYASVTGNIPEKEEYKLSGPVNLSGTLTLTIMKFVPMTVIQKGGEFKMPEMAEQYFVEEISELMHMKILEHKKDNTYIFTAKGVAEMKEYLK
jgi:hypothetical protein